MSDGQSRAFALENAALRVTVEARGGKVTEVECLRHQRDWIHTPEHSETHEARSDFTREEAYGWDECFPTLLRCHTDPQWLGERDHGELWGRAWQVESVTNEAVALNYRDPRDRFTFRRVLSLDGPLIRCAYSVSSSAGLSFLWAMHPLLNVQPGDQLFTPPGEMRVTGEAGMARELLQEPGALIPPWDGLSVLKAYVSPTASIWSASVKAASGCQISFRSSSASSRHLGIYYNGGGWPSPDTDLYQVALELTSSPWDDYESATREGQVASCPPAGACRWDVDIAID